MRKTSPKASQYGHQIHQKSNQIVSVPPRVSNGTSWHQKVVPEGGLKKHASQRLSKIVLEMTSLCYFPGTFWPARAEDRALSFLRRTCKKTEQSYREPTRNGRTTREHEGQQPQLPPQPRNSEKNAGASPWDVATFGVYSRLVALGRGPG